MQTMTLLWIVWAGITAIALSLLLYRSMLTRYEEDQLFLNDNILSEEHHRQEDLVLRIHRVQPFLNAAGGVAGLMLVGLVGTLTWQAWLTMH